MFKANPQIITNSNILRMIHLHPPIPNPILLFNLHKLINTLLITLIQINKNTILYIYNLILIFNIHYQPTYIVLDRWLEEDQSALFIITIFAKSQT